MSVLQAGFNFVGFDPTTGKCTLTYWGNNHDAERMPFSFQPLHAALRVAFTRLGHAACPVFRAKRLRPECEWIRPRAGHAAGWQIARRW